jgi:hypothetical protein
MVFFVVCGCHSTVVGMDRCEDDVIIALPLFRRRKTEKKGENTGFIMCSEQGKGKGISHSV